MILCKNDYFLFVVNREKPVIIQSKFFLLLSLKLKYFLFYSLCAILERRDMHGVKRVLTFCCLVAIVPTLLIICPLYLKHEVFKDMVYSVAESDILEVRQGISTIFCQEHSLKMNTSFNAFQLHHMPEEAKTRKHIRLKKSMKLPDDTLEYWVSVKFIS